MAMVHQLQEGDTTNRDSLEENQSHTSEEPSSRPSSRSSARSRSTPGPLPEYQYSKDELLKLSKLPYTRKRPPCLDPAYNNTSGKWDPERWFISKRGDRSLEEPRSKRERGDSDIISHKRRTSDPKERVREERDDIVLSPQRRSFGTGCHVIQQSSLARRPGSPVDNRESESSFREPSRRIGSGRIITRDRDQRDWDHDHRERDYGYGGRGHRYDQDDNEKEGRRYSHRYNRGDRRFYRGRSDDRIEEEEPEWFSGGPTSQSETIELVGFDDIPNDFDNKKISKKPTGKKIKDIAHRQSSVLEDGEKLENMGDHSSGRGNRNLVEDVVTEIERSSTPDGNLPNSQPEKQEFDLDDIFKMDWFPGLIPNGTPPDRTTQEMGCSRFSQWFKRDRDSPVLGMQGSGENSRRSSLQDELIAHVLNGIGEPQLVFPSSPPGNSSDSYFTPISPALPHSFTSSTQHSGTEGGKNILEILQNANSNNEPIINGEDAKTFKDKELNGHAKSVEELEADLKRLVLGGKTKTQEEDRSAFNKLLRHLADNASPPSSISIGPLDKSKVLQEEDLLQNILGRATPSPPPPPCHPSQMIDDERNIAHEISDLGRHQHSVQPDIFSQLLQQQQQQQQQQRQQHNVQGLTVDMLAKLLGAHPSGTPPQPSLSPTSITNVHHPSAPNSLHSAFTNRNDQHSLAALLQQQRQRELLSSLLKQQQHQQQPHHPQPPVMSQPPLIQHRPPSSQEIGPLGMPPVAGGLSPRQSPLPADTIGPTIQGRIPSPLVFGQQPPALSHAPAPIHPAHLAQAITQNSAATSNTLQVQTPLVLPRVPSPQELAVHTQSILQNALIKRKLEEQKENFRKRQEAQRSPYSTWETGTSSFLQDCIGESSESRTRSPNVTVNNNKNSSNSSPPKGLSPTMAAFTPTSVMRKMHSEKLDKESQSKPESIQGTGVRALGSQECKLLDTVNSGTKLAANNLIASTSVVEGSNVANPSQQCSNLILSHGSAGTISGTFGPRPLHGQGIGNQTRPQNHTTTNAPTIIIPGQGRPIVKGGSLQINPSGDNIVRGTIGSKAGIPHNKHFLAGNPPGHLLHHDMNSGLDSVAKLMEQRLLQQQAAALAAQRQLNNSPMPPISPATFGLGPRGPAITPHHAGLVRPGALNIGSTVGTPNLNLPLLRSVMQANLNNPALRAQASSLNQLTQFNQLNALQQQLQRGGLDSRQLQALAQTRGLHPVALQQLLINAQTQAAAAAAAVTAAQVQAGMAGGRGDGKQHLVPGQPSTNRQSPVNLAKWFGNDVLKQKMPDMPPVPHQNALLVEEVERQQQQSATVHN